MLFTDKPIQIIKLSPAEFEHKKTKTKRDADLWTLDRQSKTLWTLTENSKLSDSSAIW